MAVYLYITNFIINCILNLMLKVVSYQLGLTISNIKGDVDGNYILRSFCFSLIISITRQEMPEN